VTRRVRIAILVPALAVLGIVLLVGFGGIPDFGHYRGPYGDVLNHAAIPERHVTNVVAATVFDYRGVDTFGEEFILFIAVMGVVLLLREQTERPTDDSPDEVGAPSLRLFGVLLVGPALTIGFWLVAFGYITPGGGFQGGVVLAAAALLLYVSRSYDAWQRATPESFVDPVEGVGAGGFVVIGLAGLVSASTFLTNVLGPGVLGKLDSGGSIGLLNVATALEVVAANVLLFREFLASLRATTTSQ
jgi:multicomponent Na+:H+ antiporter subunit B